MPAPAPKLTNLLDESSQEDTAGGSGQARRSEKLIEERDGLHKCKPRIAVLIPCHNEAVSISKVVSDFRSNLPDAHIYVYDNNSTDSTRLRAIGAEATVRSESRQGKGHVVRRMFADIDADFYLLVDGDDTYDVAVAPEMIRLAQTGYDLVNVSRVAVDRSSFRRGHRFGNRLLSWSVQVIFGRQTIDMLSGYKTLSRRLVKSFPVKSTGFEIETELLIHVLELSMPSIEISGNYHERSIGSFSKLQTFRDGFKILSLIVQLIRDERPMQFFAVLACILGAASFASGLPVILEFMSTGLVPRLPTAVLATGLGLAGLLALNAGLILDSVARGRREAKILKYLSIPPYLNDDIENVWRHSVPGILHGTIDEKRATADDLQ